MATTAQIGPQGSEASFPTRVNPQEKKGQVPFRRDVGNREGLQGLGSRGWIPVTWAESQLYPISYEALARNSLQGVSWGSSPYRYFISQSSHQPEERGPVRVREHLSSFICEAGIIAKLNVTGLLGRLSK